MFEQMVVRMQKKNKKKQDCPSAVPVPKPVIRHGDHLPPPTAGHCHLEKEGRSRKILRLTSVNIISQCPLNTLSSPVREFTALSVFLLHKHTNNSDNG